MARTLIPYTLEESAGSPIFAKRHLASVRRLVSAIPEVDAELRGSDFNGPICYAWLRGGKCLYVGQSTRAYLRLFSHNIIRPRDIQPDDVIFVWRCASARAARRLESLLIAHLKPKLNKAGVFYDAEGD